MTYDGLGISPIGLGLGGSVYGDYSYYMPSMMGAYGMGGYSPYGAYGFAPMMEYQQYMQRLQNQLDVENLKHTNVMHQGMINNEVKAHEDSLSGIVQKLVTDGAVQERLMTMYRKIQEGDTNGVAQEYDKLKERVYETFSKEIASKGIDIGRADEARKIIATMYQDVINAAAGDNQLHTLEGDIQKYCDGAFQTGFVNSFKNQDGQRDKDELINHIYGTRINNYESKQSRKAIGKGVGVGASLLTDVVEGSVLGAGASTAILATAAGVRWLLHNSKKAPINWQSWGNAMRGGAKACAIIGMVAMLGYDIYSRIKKKDK